ncbi:MAG: S8 family serine peptidase [Verrucomicrobiales bacterium]|nr:S8 family serine peptidase [Verrucomicrobiales bacterium]
MRPVGVPHTQQTKATFDGRLLVRLFEPAQAPGIFRELGVGEWHPIASRQHYFMVDAGSPDAGLELARKLMSAAEVAQLEPVLARQRSRKTEPNDPLFPRQWHLRNTGQSGGLPGIDLNCLPVWQQVRGEGVTIGIVDDGLQSTHPDLSPNLSDLPGWDWNDGDGDPSPGNLDEDIHGTQVAGLIAAREGNGIGVTGGAPRSQLVSLRLIAAPTTDSAEAEALLYLNDRLAVKNCSWGAPDGTGLLEGIGPLATAALQDAAELGRGGRGSLIVFAGGNGRGVGDNANYDGFANSPYTIAVGSVNDHGTQTSYGEPGACLVVSAPSGSSGLPRLTTTDLLGLDGAASGDYTTNFTGTSASAPLVSATLALMLSKNPQLGWRDAQEILIRSAVRNDPSDLDWQTNGAGLHFNHKYGAGLVNAEAAVVLAAQWQPLGDREQTAIERSNLDLSIPDNQATGLRVSLPVMAPRFRVEHATLQVQLTHDDWGDLHLLLKSPSGMTSLLAEPHSPAFGTTLNWTFLSVRHWGEPAEGEWVVELADRRFLNTGQLTRLKLELFGTFLPPERPALVGRTLPSGFELSFRGETGVTYQIQRSATIDAWETIVTLSGTGGESSYLDADPPAAQRFYRIVISTPGR